MKVVETGSGRDQRRNEALEKNRSKVGQSPVTSTQNPVRIGGKKKKGKKKPSVKTLIVVKWKKKS